MGGMGSTRWGGYTRRTRVEECRWLDVRRFVRAGIIARGTIWGGSWWWRDDSGREVASMGLEATEEQIVLSYTLTTNGTPVDVRYAVPLTWTTAPPVPWFVCPGRGCGRRVAKLYLPVYTTARLYLCRHCHGLSYESRQQWDKRIAFFRRHPDLAAAIMRDPGARWSVKLAALRAGLWRL